MARKEIKAIFNDDELNNLNHNFEELYNEYIAAGLNAKTARQKAFEALKQSNQALLESKRTQQELDQAILKGDSSPLGGQLSVGYDGQVHSSPQERLIIEHTELIQDIETINVNTKNLSKKIDRVRLKDIQEPLIICHRGARNVFPENTIEAYRNCLSLGLKLIEQDVQHLSDGSLAVMHDDRIDRTTNRTGYVRNYSTSGFTNLKVTTLPNYKDVSPPLFGDVLNTFGTNAIFFPESKDRKSAKEITDMLIQHGLEEYALVQSAERSELSYPISKGIPTLLLTNSASPSALKREGIEYVGVSSAVSESYIGACKKEGIKVIVYTINRRHEFEKFLSLGVNGIFTDDPLWVTGKSPVLKMDPFGEQVFTHGHFSPEVGNEFLSTDRGNFYTSDKFGWAKPAASLSNFSLQGWAGKLPDRVNIDVKMIFEELTADTRWASVAFCTPKDFFNDGADGLSDGYHLLLRASGNLEFYRKKDDKTLLLSELSTEKINVGDEVSLRIEIWPNGIAIYRTDKNQVRMDVTDTMFRGGYLHLGRRELGATFRDIYIS